jgi:hypothetical protein
LAWSEAGRKWRHCGRWVLLWCLAIAIAEVPFSSKVLLNGEFTFV